MPYVTAAAFSAADYRSDLDAIDMPTKQQLCDDLLAFLRSFS